MKTKVEINEYVIEIEEIEGTISVKAEKDGEVIEEFSLESGSEKGFEEEGTEGEEIKGFGDFEEEEDFEKPEESDEEEFEDEDEVQDEEELEDEEKEDDEEEKEEEKIPGALESFQTFINKRKK